MSQYVNPRPPRVLHCYGPQHRAASLILSNVFELSPRVLRPVDQPYQLQGLEDIDFVIITNHPNQVPQDINRMLLEQGAVLWILDDSGRRGRYNREQQSRTR